MALARVELGAMIATFTNNPQPFETIRPSRFEFEAYKSLLLDGTRMHYWGLVRDPGLKQVTRTSPVNPIVLSYSRRLALARAMLRATVKSGIADYSPSQFRELAVWKRDLDNVQLGLVAMIRAYLLQVETHASSVNTSRAFQIACMALLRAEKKELKGGTAKIKSYNN